MMSKALQSLDHSFGLKEVSIQRVRVQSAVEQKDCKDLLNGISNSMQILLEKLHKNLMVRPKAYANYVDDKQSDGSRKQSLHES